MITIREILIIKVRYSIEGLTSQIHCLVSLQHALWSFNYPRGWAHFSQIEPLKTVRGCRLRSLLAACRKEFISCGKWFKFVAATTYLGVARRAQQIGHAAEHICRSGFCDIWYGFSVLVGCRDSVSSCQDTLSMPRIKTTYRMILHYIISYHIILLYYIILY